MILSGSSAYLNDMFIQVKMKGIQESITLHKWVSLTVLYKTGVFFFSLGSLRFYLM